MKNEKPTILVTGGAGYIGSMTVRRLLDEDLNVVVLDNLEAGHKEAVDKRAKLEIANLSNSERTTEIFDKYQPDAVIDFAAYLAVGESMEDPKKYLENNVFNFVKLLDVMSKKGCKYIIKSSTASTYGNPLNDSDFPLKEEYQERFRTKKSALLPGKWDEKNVEGDAFFDSIIDYYQNHFKDRPELILTNKEIAILRIPASVYGLTKLLDEILMKKYNKISQINWVALRYFNVCGADPENLLGEDKPEPTTLMTMVIYSILGKTGPLKVFGNDYPTTDGTGIRDYIHPLDLATGHSAALHYIMKTNKSGIFNLGCGKGYSVFDVINAVERASNQKVKYDIVSRRSGDPAVSYASPERAKLLLDWSAKYNLADMAESAWKWHSQYPEGYRSAIING